MQPNKRRHHYIPRFLLNRFASRIDRKRKKSWIWEISADNGARELSTKDVAVGSHFYGRDGSTLENKLAGIEAQFAVVLAQMDRGAPPEAFNADLRKFIWLHALRTRTIRTQFASTGETLLTKFVTHLGSQEGQEAIVRIADGSWDKWTGEEIAKLPESQRDGARAVFAHPGVKKWGLERLRSIAADGKYARAVSNAIDQARSEKRMSKSIASGQIRGIESLINKGPLPDWFIPDRWNLLKLDADTFVLGDACVFCVSEHGAIGSIPRIQGDWRQLYFPLSPKQVLVAIREPNASLLDPNAINIASARVSLSNIYASGRSDHMQRLIREIGTLSFLMSEDEAMEVVRSALNNSAPPA